jgi:hypothetical protein
MSMQQVANSYSTVTNIRFGSSTLKDFWWNVTAVQLPTISLSIPEINTRSGTMINLAADTVVYSELQVSLLVDKDWIAYDMIYSYFLEGLNVETGTFSHYKKFDLWMEIVDGEGKVQKKFWFYNCRVSDISGLIASPEDAEDTLQTLDVTFNVMYFKVDRPKYAYNGKTGEVYTKY